MREPNHLSKTLHDFTILFFSFRIFHSDKIELFLFWFSISQTSMHLPRHPMVQKIGLLGPGGPFSSLILWHWEGTTFHGFYFVTEEGFF